MMLSAMLWQLQNLLRDYGDLPVWLADPATGWTLNIALDLSTVVHGRGLHTTDGPLHVTIFSGHSSEYLIDADIVSQQEGDIA
jgi:hypothetical protein